MKRIAILGSTGSIGIQTLEVAREHRNDIQIRALVAHSNIELLEQQIREFMPRIVCVYDDKKAKLLKENIKDLLFVSRQEWRYNCLCHRRIHRYGSGGLGWYDWYFTYNRGY